MDSPDRRTHFRLPKEARVSVQEVTYPLGLAPETEVRMLDLSEGGAKLDSPAPFECGSLLQVAIRLEGWQKHTAAFLKHAEDALSRPLTALCRVARCVPTAGGRHDVGLQFVDIWDDHWRAVRVFLEREARAAPGAES